MRTTVGRSKASSAWPTAAPRRATPRPSRRLLLCAPLLVTPLANAAPARRVVTLGGTVTEIVYALGAGDRLVGVDDSSFFPPAARQLPRVGYYRGFAVEGVAALAPDLILASEQAGPPHALAQLARLGKTVLTVPSAPTVEALAKAIEIVALAVGQAPRAGELVADIRAGVDRARQQAAALGAVRVLLLSSHTGRLQAAGRETAADAMLALAGATNVFAGQNGYKEISPEAVAALGPEAIVTTTRSLRGFDGVDGFAAQPGISVTPAARRRRLVVIDDLLLLGFGPRVPQALRQLQEGLWAPPSPR
jgi:iron complex transport system substrate-binding protein